MSILIQNGDIIAGGGVPVLHMPTADYLANKTALDNTDVFVDITDEPDQLAYADEIGYGDTTLDYVGDIATQALGDVELTDTATKLHTVGSYFVNKAGKYCKTTVQINVGSTIVVGTNCVETSVANEISGINSDLSAEMPKYIDVTDTNPINLPSQTNYRVTRLNFIGCTSQTDGVMALPYTSVGIQYIKLENPSDHSVYAGSATVRVWYK